MSLLNSDEPVKNKFIQSNPSLIIVLLIFLFLAGLGLAVFAGYQFGKNQGNNDVSEKILGLQKEIQSLKKNTNDKPVDSTLLEMDIDEIKSKIDNVDRKLGNIEDDVSSIQRKIGY